MMVGTTGIDRVVRRTADLMREHDTTDVAPFGGINLDTLQRYVNAHYSVSLDLFGAEASSNAANYFAAGLKGRFQESRREDDHLLHDEVVNVPGLDGGQIVARTVPALSALNLALRDDYREDCEKGLERWNRTLAPLGAELRLPHAGFNRRVGAFGGAGVSPDGQVVTASEWAARCNEWLPTDADRAHVESVMRPVTEPGRMAGWLAPPSSGIHTKPAEFEYVRF
jgi:benzoyl-CoA 2,3-dioxygenase component B